MSCTYQEAPFTRGVKKAIMVTYPHCDLNRIEALSKLQDVLCNLMWEYKYIIACEEKHKDGQPHVHAVIVFESPMYIGKDHMKKFDLQGHMEGEWFHPNIGGIRSLKAAIDYVKKDGNWKEIGESPIKKVEDKAERNKKILEGKLDELVDSGEVSLYKLSQLQKAKELYRWLKEGMITELPPKKVFWLHGPTGVGKTRYAIDYCLKNQLDYWISSDNLKWFDGYTGQKVAIIDDIRTNTCEFNFLLRLLDRYKLSVPIKGGFTWWVPEVIFVTCPVPPRELFINHETGKEWDHVNQLERRITATVNLDEEVTVHPTIDEMCERRKMELELNEHERKVAAERHNIIGPKKRVREESEDEEEKREKKSDSETESETEEEKMEEEKEEDEVTLHLIRELPEKNLQRLDERIEGVPDSAKSTIRQALDFVCYRIIKARDALAPEERLRSLEKDKLRVIEDIEIWLLDYELSNPDRKDGLVKSLTYSHLIRHVEY